MTCSMSLCLVLFKLKHTFGGQTETETMFSIIKWHRETILDLYTTRSIDCSRVYSKELRRNYTVCWLQRLPLLPPQHHWVPSVQRLSASVSWFWQTDDDHTDIWLHFKGLLIMCVEKVQVRALLHWLMPSWAQRAKKKRKVTVAESTVKGRFLRVCDWLISMHRREKNINRSNVNIGQEYKRRSDDKAINYIDKDLKTTTKLKNVVIFFLL